MNPIFHEDSYGYRPGRSALDAVARCRERCWKTDWVVDLDIKAFFDTIPHDLIEKAVAHHTRLKWLLLYVRRWLEAPLQREDGTLVARGQGSPQGSAISPLLTNLTCPTCHLPATTRDGFDRRGRQRFACHLCHRDFTHASSSAFSGYRWPPEVIVTAVRWYLSYPLSARQVTELLGERGTDVSARTVLTWTQTFGPQLAGAARRPAT